MLVISFLILCIWGIEFVSIRFLIARSLLASQLFRLLSGLFILSFCYFFDLNQNNFLRIGNLTSTAHPVNWLGITEDESWKKIGAIFLFLVSVVTFFSIYFPNKKQLRRPAWSYQWLLIILFLAFNNAAIEEILYRLIPLNIGGLPPSTLALFSGLAFGLPHYFGYPSKWVGVFLAGFLGWFLAKSVLETQGIFLAFLFHWIQDILIIGILSLSKTPSMYSCINDNGFFHRIVLPVTAILCIFFVSVFFVI